MPMCAFYSLDFKKIVEYTFHYNIYYNNFDDKFSC